MCLTDRVEANNKGYRRNNRYDRYDELEIERRLLASNPTALQFSVREFYRPPSGHFSIPNGDWNMLTVQQVWLAVQKTPAAVKVDQPVIREENSPDRRVNLLRYFMHIAACLLVGALGYLVFGQSWFSWIFDGFMAFIITVFVLTVRVLYLC